MSAGILGEVGQALAGLLRERLARSPADRRRIALISPADAPGSDVRLGLFLYAVVEGTAARNVPLRAADAESARRAPPTLDLHYLLTAYPEPGSDSEALHERAVAAHALLGRAMQVLAETARLAVEPSRDVPTSGQEPRVMLEALGAEELTRLWAAFPGARFQPSVSYLVTPVRLQ